jgi:flagellar motor switch protein FliM
MPTDVSNPGDRPVETGQGTVLVLRSGGRREHVSHSKVQRHDFRQPAFLARDEMRRLRSCHEEFVRAVASRLSVYLRVDVALQFSKLDAMTYQDLTRSIAAPAHVTLFKAEPLQGVCLLDVPPKLGLTIVERLLGGSAGSSNESRELTEIETALLDQTLQIICAEWCGQWRACRELKPTLLGHENNARFLQTSPRDTVMVCVSLEARIGDCVEQMRLAFPHHTLEPLVKYLATLATIQPQSSAAVPGPVRWNAELNEISVGLTANWNGVQMTAREIASLKSGDVVLLDPQLTQELELRLASVPKFHGRLGTRGAKWAVEVTKTLKD